MLRIISPFFQSFGWFCKLLLLLANKLIISLSIHRKLDEIKFFARKIINNSIDRKIKT